MFKLKHLKLLACGLVLLSLAGCITNTIRQGELEEGVYRSSTKEFSLSIPAEAVVRDGDHPLGGYVTVSKLPAPILRQGVAYYRVSSPASGLSQEEERDIVKSGHDDWLKGYAQLATDAVLHEEWSTSGAMQTYFSVIEGSAPGFLVKPGSYYGAYSFISGNYSYVLFEQIEAPYQLKGTDDSPERLEIKSPEDRRNAIMKFASTVGFYEADRNRFPLSE